MDIFHPDGSITSIGSWSECDLKLGVDWVLFTKKSMDNEAGVDVKVKV
jgi:hypothetical protein